jgi:hypothetical protein
MFSYTGGKLPVRTIFSFICHDSLKRRLRMRMAGSLLLLIAAAAILPGKARMADAPQPMPGLRGEAATEYLKRHGLYGSLMEAVKTEINPQSFSEIKKVTASDGEFGDSFGFSVAIYEDTAIIGAPNDEVGGLTAQGSAYIFQRNQDGADQWGQVKKLIASDGSQVDNFGNSVSIHGDTAIVAANSDSIGSNIFQGSAYIFERNQGGPNNWGEVKKLTASDGAAIDLFGGSVAIYEDTVIVGVSGGNIGSNSNQGSAYVFERDQGGPNNWGQVKKLAASDGGPNENFGGSVAIYEDTIVVGAGSDRIESNFNQGSAYIFERNQGGPNNWGETRKLTASDGASGDSFGHAAIYEDTIVVTAVFSDIGSNLNQGSAYIFERDQGGPNNWGEVKKLTASDGAAFAAFGTGAAIYEDTVVIGAAGDLSQGDTAPGSAYVFKRNHGGTDNWGEVNKLTPSDSAAVDLFGSTAIYANTAIVGAFNGDGGRGSAYVFAAAGNSPPAISASPVTLAESSSATNNIIATVSDPDQAAGALAVTVNGSTSGTVNGVTVSNIIVNDSGEVGADIVAACGASNAGFTLRVTDGEGLFAEAALDVTVTPENVAPVITLKPAISLWPPNHSYHAVTVAQMVESVSDNCASLSVGDVVIEKVTSDEPDDGLDGGDIIIAANCRSVQLRAERAETGDGRVYTVTLRLRDNRGNVTRRDFEVSVPIGQNGIPAVKGATALTVTGSCQ